MSEVIVGSTNQVKLDAVSGAFGKAFPDMKVRVTGLEVSSGVSDQPMTDWETYRGAVGRARAVREQAPDCDIAVGIEGGIDRSGPDLAAFAWAVLIGKDRVGRGRSGLFILPPAVAELVKQGIELGHADDIVFGRSDSKRKNGAVGLLTDDLIDRRLYYEHMMILALIPFLKEEHYPPERPDLIYHLAEKAAYERSLESGEYRCSSLEAEGFIHCSTAGQVQGVAERFYAGAGGMVLLEVDPLLLSALLCYERGTDLDEDFPHVYGPVTCRAVTGVTMM